MTQLYVDADYVDAGYTQTGITVNWVTGVIFVPKFETTLIQTSPTEIRQLNLDSFRLILRDLEDDPDGRPWPKTHLHNTTVTVGGVTLARVIEILEPYTITFEDGQYAVNLVSANSNVGDRVNVNQVSVRSANSAGLVDLEILTAAAYQGHVVVSPNSPTAQDGTDEPIGTFAIPSKNMVDALLIAIKQGVRQFTFLEDMTLTQNFSLGYKFVGISPFVTLTLNDEADVTGCALSLLTVQGQLDGMNTVRDCSIKTITDASGYFEKCSFTERVTSNGKMDCYDCFSQVEGEGYPEFVVGSNNLVFRNYKGSAAISGASIGHLSSVGLSEGRLILESDNSGGQVHMRGQPFDIVEIEGNRAIIIDETEGLKVRELYLLEGLDPNNPMTVTQTTRTAGEIDLGISGDGTTSTTVTRDPLPSFIIDENANFLVDETGNNIVG